MKKYLAYLIPEKRVDLPKEYIALEIDVFIGERLIESRMLLLSSLIGILLFFI